MNVAQSIEKLGREIKREWRNIEPELKRCLKQGDYERERLIRSRAVEREEELIRQWIEWRSTQPPFITKEGKYYYRHPITPENEHLLKPPIKTAPFRGL
jgi:hypothetical protein